MFWRSGSVVTDEVEDINQSNGAAKRPRRRMRIIVTLALSGMLGGFLISYVFPAKYTSQSTVLVQGQKVPESLAPSLITDDLSVRTTSLMQQVLARRSLQRMLASIGVESDSSQSDMIERIQQNVVVEPVSTGFSEAAKGTPIELNVSYTDSKPWRAQKICNALTASLAERNLKDRAERIKEVIDFLKRQIDDAKANLSTLGEQLRAKGNRQPLRNSEADEKNKVLARDYDIAQKGYEDLLSKLRQAQTAERLENESMGEQWVIAVSASLPEAPDFPDRLLLALGGLGAGLILGVGRALWPIRKAKAEPQTAIPYGDSAVSATRTTSQQS